MRVLNNLLFFNNNQTNNSQRNIYFLGKYHELSEISNSAIASIRKDIQEISENISTLHHGRKIAAIRKGYRNLVARKGPGFTFKIPQYNEELSIIQGKNDDVVRFTVKSDIKNDQFIINGNQIDYNDVPQKDANQYLQIAREEIAKFKKYISQKTGSGKSSSSTGNKYATSTAKSVIKAEKYSTKDTINEFLKFMDSNPENLSQEISATIAPNSNKIIKFSYKTSDGSTMDISKVVNPMYGDSLPYMLFKLTSKYNQRSYLAVDLNEFKFLKVNDKGRPLISRNNMVYEYTEEDVEKRGFARRIKEYLDELLTIQNKSKKTQEVKAATPVPEKQINDSLPEQLQKEAQNHIENVLSSINEKLNAKVKTKAAEDAKTLVDEYFKTFLSEVQKRFSEQIEGVNAKLSELLGKQ